MPASSSAPSPFRFRPIENTLLDLRFAIRMLRRQPAFTATAALTLALGIGFVATLFTLVHGIAYRGMPFAKGKQIVATDLAAPLPAEAELTQKSFSAFAVVRAAPATLSGDGAASRQAGAWISPEVFRLLGVSPRLGRAFVAEDFQPGAAPVAIIGDALWRTEFKGEEAALGRTVRIDGQPHAIVGVMPPGFGFPRNESLWRPFRGDGAAGLVIGRLHDGVTPAQASLELTLIRDRLGSDGGSTRRPPVEVVPFATRGVKGAVRNLLTGILGATLLVLFLCCANVANLVLVRAADRGRELAVRSALGASRSRLIAQMMCESLVLSLLGGVLGIAAAHLGTGLLWRYLQREAALTGGVPFWVTFEVDGAVLAFAAAITTLSAVLIGLVPALRASRFDLNQQLKSGHGTGRISVLARALVNVQMAMSVCVVVAAGLFASLLRDANAKELPYPPQTVLTARVALPRDAAADPTGQRGLSRLLARLAAEPGVVTAAATSAESLRPAARSITLEGMTDGHGGRLPVIAVEAVTPEYFDALKLKRERGRLLSAGDTSRAPAVAVVNTEFVRRQADGRDVLGRRLRYSVPGNEDAWITIVGVVADAGSMKAAQRTDGPRIYRPQAQEPSAAVTLLLRSDRDALGLVDGLRQAVAAHDPDMALAQVHTVERILELERIGLNLPGVLLVLCGAGALALASVGVYGVVAFSVRGRTREFGVRMALGASRLDILRLVVGGGFRQLLWGLGAGVLLALGASAALSAMFVGLGRSAFDLPVYAAVVLLLAGVGGAALWLPARRACRVDPMVALRSE